MNKALACVKKLAGTGFAVDEASLVIFIPCSSVSFCFILFYFIIYINMKRFYYLCEIEVIS